jgi:hypothetical protein
MVVARHEYLFSVMSSSPNRNRPRTRTRPRFRDPWVEAGLLPGNACGSPPVPK